MHRISLSTTFSIATLLGAMSRNVNIFCNPAKADDFKSRSEDQYNILRAFEETKTILDKGRVTRSLLERIKGFVESSSESDEAIRQLSKLKREQLAFTSIAFSSSRLVILRNYEATQSQDYMSTQNIQLQHSQTDVIINRLKYHTTKLPVFKELLSKLDGMAAF